MRPFELQYRVLTSHCPSAQRLLVSVIYCYIRSSINYYIITSIVISTSVKIWGRTFCYLKAARLNIIVSRTSSCFRHSLRRQQFVPQGESDHLGGREHETEARQSGPCDTRSERAGENYAAICYRRPESNRYRLKFYFIDLC